MLIAFGRGKRYVKCTECGELFGVQVESKMDYLFDQILRCPNCGSDKIRLTSIFIKTDHEVWDQINKVEL
jgi:Zn finger protein HypA/HybF involved in hydrogenase expression